MQEWRSGAPFVSNEIKCELRQLLSFAYKPLEANVEKPKAEKSEANPKSDHVVHLTGEDYFDKFCEISSDIQGLIILQMIKPVDSKISPAWFAVSRKDMNQVIDQLCIARDRVFPYDDN